MEVENRDVVKLAHELVSHAAKPRASCVGSVRDESKRPNTARLNRHLAQPEELHIVVLKLVPVSTLFHTAGVIMEVDINDPTCPISHVLRK